MVRPEVKERTIQVLRQLFRDAYCRDFSLALWDGTLISACRRERFVLHLKTPFALRSMLMPPIDLNPGRAFVEDVADITGDLKAGVNAIMHAFLDLSKRDALTLCAYFDEGMESLAEAQIAKIDYVLAKLRLARGERLLDIGCGWGTLIMRAAERFGAVAHGITLSRVQYEEASRRIAERNLDDRVIVELRDYPSKYVR
jgi:hypothetical protein